MDFYKKTYGIAGVTTYYTQIHQAGVSVEILFEGGRVSLGYSQPATYTTENPIIQQFIERSQEYKAGRFTLISEVPIPKPRCVKTVSYKAITQAEENNEAINVPTTEEREEVKDTKITDNRIVKVACLDDARDYLQMNLGVRASKLRTLEAVKKCAEEFGISLDGI